MFINVFWSNSKYLEILYKYVWVFMGRSCLYVNKAFLMTICDWTKILEPWMENEKVKITSKGILNSKITLWTSENSYFHFLSTFSFQFFWHRRLFTVLEFPLLKWPSILWSNSSRPSSMLLPKPLLRTPASKAFYFFTLKESSVYTYTFRGSS